MVSYYLAASTRLILVGSDCSAARLVEAWGCPDYAYLARTWVDNYHSCPVMMCTLEWDEIVAPSLILLNMASLLPFLPKPHRHFLFSSQFASKVVDMQTFLSLVGVEVGQYEVELVDKNKAEIEGDVAREELPYDSEIAGPKESEHVKMVEIVPLFEFEFVAESGVESVVEVWAEVGVVHRTV
ncbi:hypothetical protein Lal_00030011, partial [Lupinus albus]